MSGGLLIMKIHNCAHQLCRNKIPLNKKYCQQHISDGKSSYNKEYFKNYNANVRDQEANLFYHSSQWTKARNYVVARDLNICQLCGDTLEDRKIIDHVHPLKVSPDEKLDVDNLWCLCYRDHQIKTMIEEQTLAKPNGVNKLKHMSKDWYKKQIQRLRAHDES